MPRTTVIASDTEVEGDDIAGLGQERLSPGQLHAVEKHRAGGGSFIAAASAAATASRHTTDPCATSVGERVHVLGYGDGVLSFFGPTAFGEAAGDWCGVTLDKATGKNDGSVQGTRYFACEPLHGVFLSARSHKTTLLQARTIATSRFQAWTGAEKNSGSRADDARLTTPQEARFVRVQPQGLVGEGEGATSAEESDDATVLETSNVTTRRNRKIQRLAEAGKVNELHEAANIGMYDYLRPVAVRVPAVAPLLPCVCLLWRLAPATHMCWSKENKVTHTHLPPPFPPNCWRVQVRSAVSFG